MGERPVKLVEIGKHSVSLAAADFFRLALMEAAMASGARAAAFSGRRVSQASSPDTCPSAGAASAACLDSDIRVAPAARDRSRAPSPSLPSCSVAQNPCQLQLRLRIATHIQRRANAAHSALPVPSGCLRPAVLTHGAHHCGRKSGRTSARRYATAPCPGSRA